MKHLSSGLRVGLAMAFCAALLAPSALADNGKKPEDRPGNSANAPGHNKDGDAAPPQVAVPETRPSETPPSPAPAEGGAAPSQAAPAAAKESRAPAVAPPVPKAGDPERPEQPEEEKKKKKPGANPRPATGKQPSAADKPAGDASAHRKVLICHATGSTKNPYVLISVSVHAWSEGHGHGAHADDVFVDWSWPGDPRQKNDALCPSSGAVAPPPTTTTSTVVPTTVPSSSAPGGPDAPGGRAVDAPSTAGDARPRELDPSFAPPAQAVEYAVLARGGFAGTAVRGTLPFTGLPVWGAALIGLSLLSLGLMLRGRTRDRAARRVRGGRKATPARF